MWEGVDVTQNLTVNKFYSFMGVYTTEGSTDVTDDGLR